MIFALRCRAVACLATLALAWGAMAAQEVRAQDVQVSPPGRVAPGAALEVGWSGPDAAGDFIALARPGAPPHEYLGYARTARGAPARQTAPDTEGDFEVRYISAASLAVLAAAPVEVRAGRAAGLRAPETVVAEAPFGVTVELPGQPADFLTVVPADAPDDTIGAYVRLRGQTRVELPAPAQAGLYEIRQVSAADLAVVARGTVRVEPRAAEPGAGQADGRGAAAGAREEGASGAVATLMALVAVDVGGRFRVAWTGPGGPDDRIALFAGRTGPGEPLASLPAARSPTAPFTAPGEPGTYLIGYVEGAGRQVIATREIEVW
ncbi:MAG TPA: hypothetical protein VMM59_11560 [Thermohalobaculum sp.]|nr:hypothetical protein [Thermohalobaculum sp.]